MTARIIVADAGGTKTTWLSAFGENLSQREKIRTDGINAVTSSDAHILRSFEDAAKAFGNRSDSSDTELYFFGAGCAEAGSKRIAEVAKRTLPGIHIRIAGDMEGAAMALCGDKPGIACILGTGANSCLWDGKRITANISPLGWILGDEGSGAVIGRVFVSDILKGMLPENICNAFKQRYNLSPNDVVEHVYNRDSPNRWLAGFMPFIKEHIADESVHELVCSAFERFLMRNVAHYPGYDSLPVNFTGSVAMHFSDLLAEACSNCNMTMGVIDNDITPLLLDQICRKYLQK